MTSLGNARVLRPRRSSQGGANLSISARTANRTASWLATLTSRRTPAHMALVRASSILTSATWNECQARDARTGSPVRQSLAFQCRQEHVGFRLNGLRQQPARAAS